jgi:coatomer subunit beta'
LQSDVVSSFLDSGKSVDDKGVEGAFKVLHHEESERFRTGVWVGDCFIYTNESWNLNYWLGGKVLSTPYLYIELIVIIFFYQMKSIIELQGSF